MVTTVQKQNIILASLLILTACSDDISSIDTVADNEYKKHFEENFESFPFSSIPQWRNANHYQGPYSELGEYYLQQNIAPPKALRNTITLGDNDWLSAEIYTRTEKPIVLDYIDVVADPDNLANKVLKISTPEHTDGVVIRSKNPLPKQYKISLKIGFAQYGDDSKLNGYNDGNETAQPWRNLSSVGHNGYYWFALLDSPPMPHNNIWIHHHRKFVIDSWNRAGNKNTVNVIALDGKSETHPTFGKKFISHLEGRWQNISDVPIDYYLPHEWYTLTFTRTSEYYEFSISGNFKNGGHTSYQDRIDYRKNCIYHYNQTASELEPNCIDNRQQRFLDKEFTAWQKDSAYPEYFMLGEPHINYYEGSVLIDDISLEEL